MSDLISRSALLQEFEKYNKLQDRDLWHITGIKAFIENQPTAYDVEKVVEELESRAEDNEYVSEILKGIESKRQLKLWLERASAFRKAIEIVKGGGVNERD